MGIRLQRREFREAEAEALPFFLSAARDAATTFADLTPFDTRFCWNTLPAASIGWHKDKPHFGDVVGISLLSSCVLRFRGKAGARWERASIVAEPRSAYLLRRPVTNGLGTQHPRLRINATQSRFGHSLR
jgi:hypothetical protein